MTVTFETRPINLGDQVMIRGAYAASDTTIDLSPYMRVVDAVQLILPSGVSISTTNVKIDVEGTPTDKAIPLSDGCFITGTGGTSVTLFGGQSSSAGATSAGQFIAIGRKG